MRVWLFSRPTIQNLIAFVLLTLPWIMPASREAIMKGTWEQHHGNPFTFAFLVESTAGGYDNVWLSHFSVVSWVADVIVIYLVSCGISFLLKEKHVRET